MNFKYSVIGDNTPENREWLEKIGYKMYPTYLEEDELIKTTSTSTTPIYFSPNIGDESINEWDIDCIGNSQLFRAVTAMRDDTSNNQWWVFNEDFDKYKKGDFVMGGFHRCSYYCHVATLSELINRFKTD